MTGKKAENKQALEDLAYWRPIAEFLRCEVVGWSYRHSCLVQDKGFSNNTIQIPAWLVENILIQMDTKP